MYLSICIYIYMCVYNPKKIEDRFPSSPCLIPIISMDSSNALNADRLTRPTVSRPNTAMGSFELKPQATLQVGSDHRILRKTP